MPIIVAPLILALLLVRLLFIVNATHNGTAPGFLTESTAEFPDAECFEFMNSTWICHHAEDMLAPMEYDDDVPDSVNKVLRLEPNQLVTGVACDWTAPWHLHTISHTAVYSSSPWLEFKNWWWRNPTVGYAYNEPQLQTRVYILDTWVDIDHKQFEGRASRSPVFAAGSGKPLHGTHVAGLVGAKRFGVNRQARLVSVQVLDDNGRGAWSTIARGLDWVSRQPGGGVVNLSIGGQQSSIIDSMVNRLADAGWLVVAAAGNTGGDACLSSPCSARGSLCVGATTQDNELASFSNRGKCVDVLAPGQSILSVLPQQKEGYMSGTSMAAPLVAGVWSLHFGFSSQCLLQFFTQSVKHEQPGTTERLLYTKPRDTCTAAPSRIRVQ